MIKNTIADQANSSVFSKRFVNLNEAKHGTLL